MSLKYDRYLQIDCWKKQLRCACLEQAKYICQARIECKGAWATEVHHKNGYDNVGVETLDELLACCRNCHRALHRLPKPANDNEQFELPLFGVGNS
jgi:5-methylcytosine-specific restriction endonuclease McrA